MKKRGGQGYQQVGSFSLGVTRDAAKVSRPKPGTELCSAGERESKYAVRAEWPSDGANLSQNGPNGAMRSPASGKWEKRKGKRENGLTLQLARWSPDGEPTCTQYLT
jgi:hypothetical protein